MISAPDVDIWLNLLEVSQKVLAVQRGQRCKPQMNETALLSTTEHASWGLPIVVT